MRLDAVQGGRRQRGWSTTGRTEAAGAAERGWWCGTAAAHEQRDGGGRLHRSGGAHGMRAQFNLGISESPVRQ